MMLLVYVTFLEFTDRLNAALLAFDINQTIDQLNSVSVSLTGLGQTALANQVNMIAADLVVIRDNQIPTIQDQSVSIIM